MQEVSLLQNPHVLRSAKPLITHNFEMHRPQHEPAHFSRHRPGISSKVLAGHHAFDTKPDLQPGTFHPITAYRDG